MDFQYPSEGIHKRWDAGFRITACAATPEQGAFVLSIPRRTMADETQETLRTSTFPSGPNKSCVPSPRLCSWAHCCTPTFWPQSGRRLVCGFF